VSSVVKKNKKQTNNSILKKVIRRFVSTAIGILIIYSVAAQSFNELAIPTLPDVARATVITADFNCDGNLDLILSGNTSSGNITRVYRNNGDSTFSNLGLGLPVLENAAAEVVDFDLDGWPDFILAGRKDGTTDGYCRIFRNQHDETFQVIDAGFPQLSFATLKSADFNNDGRTDVFIMGMEATQNVTNVYINEGDFNFTAGTISFPQLGDGDAYITDLNKDGFDDIIYSGLNGQLYERTYIYVNNGNGNFTEKLTDIPYIQADVVRAVDINSDGYDDIFLSGRKQSGNYVTEIWQNNHFASFTLHSTFTVLKNADMAFADYNHDGYTDIVIGGRKESDGAYYSELNENNAGTGFNASIFSIDSIDYAGYCWIDLNNDKKIDLISTGYSITGQQTSVYIANTLPVNQQPGIPSNLNAGTFLDSVQFSWDSPSDDITHTSALSYEMFIFDYKGKQIRTTLSDTVSGVRWIGNNGTIKNNGLKLYNFSEGKYFWAVQAIDQSFAGGAFSAIDSFTIVKPISIGNDNAVCINETVTLSVSGVDGTAEWFSAKNKLIPFSSDKNVEVLITQTDTIWVDITKDFGSIVSDTIIISMYNLPIVELGTDIKVCPGSEVQLTQGGINDVVNWSTNSGNYSALNTTVFNNSFDSNDKIYVELTDINGCTNTDSVNIIMNAIPAIELKEDTSVCKYNEVQIIVDNNTDSINWYSLTQGILKTNSNFIDIYVESTDTLWIDAYTNEGCVNFDTIVVKARELPLADAGADKLICEGYSTQIGPEVPLEGASYVWNPEINIDNLNIPNPLVSPNSDQKYYVQVTDIYGCKNTDSVLVQINPKGVFDVGNDTSVCPGESIQLGGNPTAVGSIMEYSYQWSPTENLSGISSSNPVAYPTETTTYRLIIFTGECPADTLYTTVTINPLPDIEIINDTLAGFQEDIQLWASGGVDYSWAPVENINNAYINDPVVNLEQTTHFTVRVTNNFGCSDTAGVTITVKNEIFIPELFSPNNDGNNDFFKVYGFGINELQLIIYNESGVVVYENNSASDILNIGWDGTYRGYNAKEGKYFWKISGKFFNGTEVLFNGKNTGIVTLLR